MELDLQENTQDKLPQLFIDEEDLDPVVASKIRAMQRGERVLDDSKHQVERILFDSLPSAIAKRVKAITPSDFRLSEIQLKFSLTGKIFFGDIGGDVVIKLAPKVQE
jgi:hypothetical protein